MALLSYNSRKSWCRQEGEVSGHFVHNGTVAGSLQARFGSHQGVRPCTPSLSVYSLISLKWKYSSSSQSRCSGYVLDHCCCCIHVCSKGKNSPNLLSNTLNAGQTYLEDYKRMFMQHLWEQKRIAACKIIFLGWAEAVYSAVCSFPSKRLIHFSRWVVLSASADMQLRSSLLSLAQFPSLQSGLAGSRCSSAGSGII